MRAWTASQACLPRLVAASLEYAGLARHPLTANGRLTSAREVVKRLLGQGADIYAAAAVRDRRAIHKRSAPPPVQVPHMTLSQFRVVRRRAARPVRYSLDVIWSSLARPSDWLGSVGSNRPPVPLADVEVLGRGLVEALYRRTKPDQEGVGRRVRIQLPPKAYRWLQRRKASLPASYPALPATFGQLQWAMRPYPLRSIRRGTVRIALMQGISARRVAAVTGHKSEATVLRYAGMMCPRAAAHTMQVSAAVWRRPRMGSR